MDAYSQLKLARVIANLLDTYCCSYCIRNSYKARQDAIAKFFYPFATILFDDRLLYNTIFFEDLKCFLFIFSHQCSITDNISEHDSSELAGLFGHSDDCKIMKMPDLFQNPLCLSLQPILWLSYHFN